MSEDSEDSEDKESQGDACTYCEKTEGKMAPSHDGSLMCESGSIASGGSRSHCSCDYCF